MLLKLSSSKPTCAIQSHYKNPSTVTMQQLLQSMIHRVRRGGKSPEETHHSIISPAKLFLQLCEVVHSTHVLHTEA